MRRWQWCIVLVCLAVGVAGCGSSARSSSRATTATTATITTSAGTTPGTTVSGTTPAGASRTASTPTSPATTSTLTRTTGTRECSTSDLAAGVGSGHGAAGTIYYQLRLRNTSSAACYEQGYPGVSLLDSSGRQIGAAAAREPGAQAKVVLSPGRGADATLAVAEAGNFPSGCSMTRSAELRVYPPDQTVPLTIPFRVQGCANRADRVLHIKPFTSSPPR